MNKVILQNLKSLKNISLTFSESFCAFNLFQTPFSPFHPQYLPKNQFYDFKNFLIINSSGICRELGIGNLEKKIYQNLEIKKCWNYCSNQISNWTRCMRTQKDSIYFAKLLFKKIKNIFISKFSWSSTHPEYFGYWDIGILEIKNLFKF